jgi:homocysteine S-methyltransferase
MDFFSTRRQVRPLLADGAMGTLLLASGVPPGACLEALVVERPEMIGAIHAAYARAGADMITTHTFGANRIRLAYYGLQDEVVPLNKAAVSLAQQVRDSLKLDFLIAGNVGPVGKAVAWENQTERAEVAAAFHEQIAALVEQGVDLLLFETFSDVEELALAVQCGRALCSLPIVASLSYGADGLTLAGQDVATVTRRLVDAGVDVVGVNCGVGPAQMVVTLSEMSATAPSAMFSVSPNAGLPQHGVDGQLHYPVDAEEFAGYLPHYLSQGVVMVGGCCGTTPAHVAALRAKLDQAIAA